MAKKTVSQLDQLRKGKIVNIWGNKYIGRYGKEIEVGDTVFSSASTGNQIAVVKEIRTCEGNKFYIPENSDHYWADFKNSCMLEKV